MGKKSKKEHCNALENEEGKPDEPEDFLLHRRSPPVYMSLADSVIAPLEDTRFSMGKIMRSPEIRREISGL